MSAKLLETEKTATEADTEQNLENDFLADKPEGLVPRLQAYIQNNLSDLIIVIVLASLTGIKFFMDAQLTALYFFFIVILGTGYALGKRFAVLTAFLTILVVWAFILSDKAPFLVQHSSDILYFYMTLWGGFLVLTGWLGSALAKTIHEYNEEATPANYSAA
ncbi:MAG: hypothetical protein E2O41_01395 [Nitrospina sp.]|nr:MAG: hypothetical protein E2O41_01395 [Nitrospina sp.]